MDYGLDAYQIQAESFQLESAKNLTYLALGLAGEAGEVANKIKKQLRDGAENDNDVLEELGDVLWYVAALSKRLGLPLSELAENNLDKLEARKALRELGGRI